MIAHTAEKENLIEMEEKKLTDDQYIQRLEYCQYPMNCCICKYKNDCFLDNKKTVDLIHRLQNDYSNLKERYVKVLDLNEKVIADQKAEIERLTEEHERQMAFMDGHQQAVKDTAKEIFNGIIENFVFVFIGASKDYEQGYTDALKDYDKKLRDFAKHYGVEVE